jgi:hypothetical protein
MLARDLKPGDLFLVTPPDPESPVRVCLSNDETYGLRFGWPGKSNVIVDKASGYRSFWGYWCHMGEDVVVEWGGRITSRTAVDDG